MAKNHRNLRVAAAVSLALCGCRAVQKHDGSDVSFIGGTAANAGEYPSTVYLQHCSAAKIGPKHFLTAAHCLRQKNTNRPSFEMVPGTKATILAGISLEKGTLIPVTITSSEVFPGFDYQTLLRDYGKLDAMAPAVVGAPLPTTVDVALVTIEEATPEIPAAEFDEGEVSPGSRVDVGGYGCEAEGEATNDLVRLRYANVPVGLVRGAMVSWRAQAETEGYRSTCHGDSGGPVYRKVNGEPKIVGVNSGSPKGYSVFTTTAGAAGTKVLTWLRNRMATPVTYEPMTFKVMKCESASAAGPSADGILRTYEFSDMKLAVNQGRKISASIAKFKVSVRPDSDALPAYSLNVEEATGCGPSVLCYKMLYTEAKSATTKLISVQLKEGKVYVYEGEPTEGLIPLGVELDAKACTLSDI